ncbi:MAG: hypothetical protein QNJ62_05760 [Methyloceanibacter sp.]|nr:hypothetical protein [Methyloceanibacter sp.]
MGLGDFHRIRGFASALALVGMLLFTALVPGHIVSQAKAFAGDPDSLPIAEMSCHSGKAVLADKPDPNGSSTPHEECPFCEGYAAFMSVLAGAPDTGMIDADRIHIAVNKIDDGVVGQIAKHTNNRGPPRLL